MSIYKKILCFLFGGFIFAAILFYFWAQDKYIVPILMYHHIDQVTHHDLNTVSPETFEMHMAYLKNNGYKVISFDELIKLTNSGVKPPRKTVVITFDDGHEDNYVYALPVLKKYNFPAIIFICSDLIGQKDFLHWDQVKELKASNVDIGSHTRTHVYLPGYPDFEKVKDEIRISKLVIQDKIGAPVDYFCYPAGGFTEEIKEFVKESGYKGAATTNRGYSLANKDVYEMKRIRMNDKDRSNFVLACKLSGFYTIFKRIKAPHVVNS